MPNKLWILLILLAFMLGTAVATLGDRLVMASEKKQVVQAQEFRLVDGCGLVRASLGLNPKGQLLVTLHDAKGQPTENMVVTPEMIKTSQKTVATVRKLENMFSGFFSKP